MPVTTEQYNRILARLTRLEGAVNDIFVAQKKMISREQINQLLVLLQTDQEDMRQTLESLEDRVETIEEEPIS